MSFASGARCRGDSSTTGACSPSQQSLRVAGAAYHPQPSVYYCPFGESVSLINKFKLTFCGVFTVLANMIKFSLCRLGLFYYVIINKVAYRNDSLVSVFSFLVTPNSLRCFINKC